MDKLWFGLEVTTVGLIGVFVGLALLILCVRALRAAKPKERTMPKAESGPAEAGFEPVWAAIPPPAEPAKASFAPPVREYVPGPKLQHPSDALYAVLTAAVAQTLALEGINPEGGFAIQSVRPVNTTSTPKLALKDDALYAIFTAAVAETLAAEGVDSEKGFTITAVNPL